jgi:hypothetical protein
MNKSNWLALIFFLFTLAFLGLWIINDAFAVVFNFGQGQGIVGNGFFWFNEVQAFHMGLYLCMISLFLLVLILIHLLTPIRKQGAKLRPA